MRPATLALVFLTAALSAQDAAAPVSTAAPAAKLAPLTADEVRQGFIQMGQSVAAQSPLPGFRTDFEMTAEEVDAFLIGLRAVMLGEAKAPSMPNFSERFETSLKERQAAKAARVKNVEVALLAKLDADKQVKKTDSGLRYQVVKAGDVALKPKATSTVTCLYHGTLTDGTVFDSTRNRNNEPVSFALGEVIPGWTEGLQLVGKGGVIKLWIPANLAYGDQQAGPIPAGSLLTFEIEVLDVK